MKKSQQKRAPQIRGICAAALRLGCNRHHLRRVLIGERQSVRLMRRYKALKDA